MTDAERLLWSRVRGKQIGPVPFCRQKPLGGYLVDFHAPNSFVPERKVMFRQNPNIETRNSKQIRIPNDKGYGQ
jgi:hypothetical protein